MPTVVSLKAQESEYEGSPLADPPLSKLAVILHADVVGSTELVRLDETVADQRMQDAFQRFSEEIASHNGVAHEIRGDALVAEFAKASDAVTASFAFQHANTSRNNELPDDIRPVVRIGIALGEVLVTDSRMTGEGVVLAQRLEQLAEPGGVCIQDAVYQTVPKRLPFTYENLGERELKGFDEPVKVYAVRQSQISTSDSGVSAQPEPTTLSQPDRAAIAVLAFTNMSGDSEQEFFCDGLTEDIITELARFPFLFVIARHSTFAFKGEKVDIKNVGEKLGVQYVVEGSVRRAGSRIRVTAQLIEADTGNHIWAERYDRELDDVFEVQDEVTCTIVAIIAAQLGKTVSVRAARKHPASIKSYEYFLQGNQLYAQFNPDDNIIAMERYKRAIELDPEFAPAYAGLANTYSTDHLVGWRRLKDGLAHGLENAKEALKRDGNNALARIALGWVYIDEGRWDDAEHEFNQELSLNSGDADILAELGMAQNTLNNFDIGIPLLEKAVRLNPLAPEHYQRWLGTGYYQAKRYRDAVVALRAGRTDGWTYAWLAASYARLGETERAREALDAFVELRRNDLQKAGVPTDETADLLGNYKVNFRYDSDWEHFVEGLRIAGLPE